MATPQAARNFTPSDSVIDSGFSYFMVTGASGDVSFKATDAEPITVSLVPVGVWIPCGFAKQIMATGTTAVGFLIS